MASLKTLALPLLKEKYLFTRFRMQSASRWHHRSRTVLTEFDLVWSLESHSSRSFGNICNIIYSVQFLLSSCGMVLIPQVLVPWGIRGSDARWSLALSICGELEVVSRSTFGDLQCMQLVVQMKALVILCRFLSPLEGHETISGSSNFTECSLLHWGLQDVSIFLGFSWGCCKWMEKMGRVDVDCMSVKRREVEN